jgi:glyoxylase-like metal-dependent hydrolase (beta-lactamase superfamily II)
MKRKTMPGTRLAATTAALWVFCAQAVALAQGPVSAAPAAWTFRVGALELTALRDGGFVTPNDGADFGSKAGSAAVAKLLAEAGAPTDKISLDVSALAVRMPGHVVLLDAGLGPANHGVLPRSLALAGVSPAEITDVLITHAHGDHVGGLLDAEGRSAFPRAVIHISAREWAWMRGQAETRALAAVVAAQVRTFEPGQLVLPGITAIALYGHTPGHVGYEIVSRGQRLEDIGDTAHSAIVSLARPDWTGGMDLDPPAAAANRRRTLERLAASDELVFAPHFPFPGVGRIAARDDGFTWKPVAASCPHSGGYIDGPFAPTPAAARGIYLAVRKAIAPRLRWTRREQVIVNDEGDHWSVYSSVPPKTRKGGVVVRAGGGLELEINKCSGAVAHAAYAK